MKGNKTKCHSKLDLESHHTLLRNDEILNQVQDDEERGKNVGQVLPDKSITCHSRGFLSGISTALDNAQGVDPRLQASGMTFNLRGETLNRNTFRAPLRSGFTLIELLVVVLIIGVLAAIALPQYQFAVAKGRFVQAKVLAKSIADAEELYYLTNGKYTADFDNLEIKPGGEKKGLLVNYRDFDWGYCSIYADNAGRAEGSCGVTIPSGRVVYWIGFKHSTYDSNRRCFASGSTDMPLATDINYRICEQDTKNPLSKVIFGGTTYSWTYK